MIDVKRIEMHARKDSVGSLGSAEEIGMGLAVKASRDSNAT